MQNARSEAPQKKEKKTPLRRTVISPANSKQKANQTIASPHPIHELYLTSKPYSYRNTAKGNGKNARKKKAMIHTSAGRETSGKSIKSTTTKHHLQPNAKRAQACGNGSSDVGIEREGKDDDEDRDLV